MVWSRAGGYAPMWGLTVVLCYATLAGKLVNCNSPQLSKTQRFHSSYETCIQTGYEIGGERIRVEKAGKHAKMAGLFLKVDCNPAGEPES